MDAKVNLTWDALEDALLSEVMGVPVPEVRARLERATLGELLEWSTKIRELQ